jgi:ABC-2 type transport system ATP-binding protein
LVEYQSFFTQRSDYLDKAGFTLELDHVSVGYRGQQRLHDLSLQLGPGLHVLLGPNGAGKTTLFRAVAGVLPTSAGTVRVHGLDPHRDAAAKARVGVAGHRSALSPRLSVRDNVEYWSRVLAQPAPVRRRRVEAVLAELEIADIAERRAGTLSRGQSQRVSLARALLGEPSVLLLDEPLSGVDPGVASRLRDQLRAMAASGRTVVVSSHELAELADLGDDVTVLQDGRVVAHGPADELRRRFATYRSRLRLRGTDGLAGALAEAGYPATERPAGALEIEVADDDAVRALVDRLVGAGVGLYEVAPVEDALTDLYLAVTGETTHER